MLRSGNEGLSRIFAIVISLVCCLTIAFVVADAGRLWTPMYYSLHLV